MAPPRPARPAPPVLRHLPLIVAIWPLLAVHATWLLAATQGHIPWCIPYLEGCTSISATGRQGAGFFVFKGTMIPAAMLFVLYWHLCAAWLAALGDGSRARPVLAWAGSVGAVFMIVYAVALGAGDALNLQRRIGITLFFGLTYLAQLLLRWRLGRLVPGAPGLGAMFAICALALGLGLLSLVLNLSIDNYDDYEHSFEWVLALLIQAFFLASARTWAACRAGALACARRP